jgi:hypothetical protein
MLWLSVALLLRYWKSLTFSCQCLIAWMVWALIDAKTLIKLIRNGENISVPIFLCCKLQDKVRKLRVMQNLLEK